MNEGEVGVETALIIIKKALDTVLESKVSRRVSIAWDSSLDCIFIEAIVYHAATVHSVRRAIPMVDWDYSRCGRSGILDIAAQAIAYEMAQHLKDKAPALLRRFTGLSV